VRGNAPTIVTAQILAILEAEASGSQSPSQRVLEVMDTRGGQYELSLNVDFHVPNKAVNDYRNDYINLRLVRDQLIRLQNAEIKVPFQLITLINRSIATG
jgi:hypothetical protein